MKTLLRLLAVLALHPWASMPAPAEERNGVHITVVKKTVARTDGEYSGSKRRKLSLAVTVRNGSIRDLPAGEVKWTMLVKRAYDGGWRKYTGTEPLKVLRYAQSAEMLVGEATAGRFRGDETEYKDRVEYQVSVMHGGKETVAASSTPTFASIAAQAWEKEAEEGEDRVADAGKEERRRENREEKSDKPMTPDGKPMAGNGTPKPGEMPPKPSEQPKDPAAMAGNTAQPEQAAPAAKPFDFFNLDRAKKKPAAE